MTRGLRVVASQGTGRDNRRTERTERANAMTRTFKLFAASALSLAVIMLALTPVSAQDEQVRERFRAVAMAMGTSNPPILPRGRTASLDINITRWSTDEEREMLFGELVENGQPALVSALRSQEETGWMRVTGPSQGGSATRFPSERLRYARQTVEEDGSRRIVLAFDRPISMYEAVRRPRWRDHDITFLVMDLDAEGNGDGQLSIGVQLAFKYDTKTLVIENFGTEPVRLTRISQRN